MEGNGIANKDGAVDLLTLIGHAIEQLRQSIELLEASDNSSGRDHLSIVIQQIDDYLETPGEDPLLHLASLPAEQIAEGLHRVRSNLTSVIDELEEAES